MGLDEYNVKNTYTTVVNNVTNSYKQVSKYRADSYGIEFARRKPFREYPTEDTNYDQDIFFIDCKDEPMYTGFGTFHQPRTYHNDFNNVPMGVFSPETAYNLRLSPFNSLLRHDWVINSGLTLYPNGKIKYASSTGNSSLKTDYYENGEIQNSNLSIPKYIPEIVEFEYELDFDLIQQLLERTNILGKDIPNVYGLAEFINENGETERGFILSVKPNEGKDRKSVV